MKAIELTQEHKTKLLEMCHKLFPEYPYGFGAFYSTEIGAEYHGLDYLDVTHTNHDIPCIKARFEVENENTDNLEIVEKCQLSSKYDKVIHGRVDNITPKQGKFANNNGVIKQSQSFDEIYIEGIHWFEMCWNILNKLLTNKPPLYIIEQIQLFGMTCFNKFPSVHPIDYLYEEFKKLK